MENKLKATLIHLLDDFPDEKISSLVDYINYLKKGEAEEEFTTEEEVFILKCWEESKQEEGIPWEKVRRGV